MTRASRRSRRWAKANLALLVLVPLATWLVSTSARAGETVETSPRFHLAYTAPAQGCPDRTAFIDAVHSRTPRSQLATEDETAVAFTVTIKTNDGPKGATMGQLEVQEPDGTHQTRHVSSRTCAEVAKALALVVALIVDPESMTAPDVEPAPAPVPPVEPIPEAQPEPAPPPPPPPPPSPPPPKRRRTPVVAPPPPPPVILAAGLELGATSAIGPAMAPSAGLLLDAEWRSGATPLRSRLVTPALRASFDMATTSSDLPIGKQTYRWFAGTVRFCPIHLPFAGAFRVAPCGAFQVGYHHGNTRGAPNPATHGDLWLAPVAEANLDWKLSRAMTLELEGGALFPLRQTRFFLAPNTTIFTVPNAGGLVRLSLRVRFR
ncbi:Autotransporter [Labilithrix luteola]|uniref:Autotransporter n=1 Tax=Labilithrix luteola TaxID=1391654 RepID=A0A0K1PXI6_9BACT|nr:hypothetical protein [Labilithrix luteola]AKU98228.1 Autotransporter [Labilithrix luteola]